ncbi:MAG: hypothetical protein K9L78_04405 [Victivallales bacterium]|nr:hypothetical protein [Victivallales bacterium]
MKLAVTILSALLINISIFASEVNGSTEVDRLNQRLDLINQVKTLTEQLNTLKTDHLSKMNKYAKLIESKEAKIKELNVNFQNKIATFQSQNIKDRTSFNSELKKQRKLLAETEEQFSEKINSINTNYLNEIADLKDKYEDLLENQAEDYTDNLTEQEENFESSLAYLRQEFEDKNNDRNNRIVEVQQDEELKLTELNKKISELEECKNLLLSTYEMHSFNFPLSAEKNSSDVKQDKDHSFFYRLIHKVI